MAENEQDKAFIEIYNATYDRICKYVILKTGDAADAPDIVQNTYMNYYGMQTKMHNIEKPINYLFKIARNEINKYYLFKEKKLREVPVFSENGNEDQSDAIELEMLLNADIQDDSNFNLKEIWQYIECFDSLTVKIFILYFQFDEKLADIAGKLGISESNVKNKLYRAIKRLQKKFGIEMKDT